MLSFRVCKRLLDIIGSLLAIALLSPAYLLISILIIITDGRPVLFKQKRTGINNTVFSIWKFRTMKVNQVSSSNSNPYNWKTGVPDDFVFKTSANPNITKIGAFLRKYSLDELPQFFNVLFGEMSIIGPRPEIPEITNCYNDIQKRRLLVKPGITGYAQINGRSDSNHGEKIKNDLYYVENMSLSLDIKIFVKTVIQSILGKGAY